MIVALDEITEEVFWEEADGVREEAEQEAHKEVCDLLL